MANRRNKDTDTDIDADIGAGTDSSIQEDELAPQAELEVGDRIRAEENWDGDTAESDVEIGESDVSTGEGGAAEEAPLAAPPTVRPVQVAIPVAPVLGRVGDTLWGAKGKSRKHELDDLFEVPQPEDNDMDISDLFTVESEDVDLDDDLSDLTTVPSDLTQVTREDVMGRPRKSRSQRKPKYRRTNRRYESPTSMGGVQ